MSGNGKIACQQCNEEHTAQDAKPTYDEAGDISGYVCNPCRLKSVEYARRCQIVDCKTRPDSGPSGFRTLPSKFYDLAEGEVKKRIIRQFGIIKNTRACCNMCYVRISKAIVQVNIVYGGGLLRQGKLNSSQGNTGKQDPSSSSLSGDSTKTPQVREDRLAEYTGPKFTRRSGGIPCWNRNKSVNENEPTVKLVKQENIVDSVTINNPVVGELNNTLKDEAMGDFENILDSNESCQTEGRSRNTAGDHVVISSSPTKIKQEPLLDNEKPREIKQEVANSPVVSVENSEKGAISYSSIPISPTSVRFRRIQPKLPKFDEFDLSGEVLDIDELTNDRKRSCDYQIDDSTWSPGAKKEKPDVKNRKLKKSVSSEVMSDFVSCMGCRKICSNKEAKPVYDYEKGFRGRLCSECRIKKREENRNCSITGCTTPLKDVILRPLPAKLNEVSGKAKEQISALGITEETKVCCKSCWKEISAIVANSAKKQKDSSSSGEQVFTMCRNCCKIVPINETFPNYEDNGRKCGVLCKLCYGPQPTGEPKVKKEVKQPRKPRNSDLSSPTIKSTLGICQVKGCVNAGQEEPVQLVSGKKILRNYLDEKMLRHEFNLDDNTDSCCRSCLARIKWFVADIRKKECGVGADGKPINSLKNLTSRIGNDIDQQNQKPRVSHAKVAASQYQVQQHVASMNQTSMANSRSLSYHPGPEQLVHIESNGLLRQMNHSDQFSDQNCSSSSNVALPPGSPMQQNPTSSHPPVLQVGGQQFVLNVISRCDKEIQTTSQLKNDQPASRMVDKGVQANIPLMPKFEGTVPANLPNGKKVKYSEAKEKTKYAVKRQGRDLFDQFLEQLNDISGGCGQQLLLDIYRPKVSHLIFFFFFLPIRLIFLRILLCC